MGRTVLTVFLFIKMSKTRKQKEEAVNALTKAIQGATSVVFAGFHKFKVSDERLLRRQLRDLGVAYTVTKKSLWKRAMSSLGITDVPTVEGQLAVAYGDDAIAPAKGIADFAKTHQGVLSILGGIFEGNLKGGEEMKVIAAIPSREVLLGMLANVLCAPVRSLAIAIDALANKKTQSL